MNKSTLRKLYSGRRQSLSETEVEELTIRMAEQFGTVSLPEVKAVLSYSPLKERNEFNVRICEDVLRSRNTAIKIAHPRIMNGGDVMEAVSVGGNTRFITNSYRIHEPFEGEILTPESFDLVLTPLLAFDLKGYRVGYGKGFYDRWLAQCRPEVLRIGFSFFEPVAAIGDINEFDVPLNLCITPMSVYEF